MTKEEYEAYQKTVGSFFATEKITNLTSGHIECPDCHCEWNDQDKCPECNESRSCFDEPFFSNRPCDCCKTYLAGNRCHATGYNPEEKQIQEYDVCEDCVYYAEYGQLDDQTMMEIEGVL